MLALNLLIVSASMPWMFLLPGWVEDVLGLGGLHLGILLSVMGVGSLFGSLVIASLPPRHRGLLYLLSAVLLAAGVLAFATVEDVLAGGVADRRDRHRPRRADVAQHGAAADPTLTASTGAACSRFT